MHAPKLRSMFRNVRTEPRRFAFRSRHLPELDSKWSDRKERVEAEVAVESAENRQPRSIRFGATRQGKRTPSTAGDDWRRRRAQQVAGARYAMLRAALIACGLVWLAWRGIQWVEQSDFSDVLKWMENA